MKKIQGSLGGTHLVEGPEKEITCNETEKAINKYEEKRHGTIWNDC